MICPVCGANIDDGSKFCTNCGANFSSMGNVSPDKIIYNQTRMEKKEAGDDSATVLIPENYMSAQGDDSKTTMINEQQYAYNQNMNQSMNPNMGYQGMNQNMNQNMNSNMGYQGMNRNMNQNMGYPGNAGIKNGTGINNPSAGGSYKKGTLVVMIILFVTMFAGLINAMHAPENYIEAYIGGHSGYDEADDFLNHDYSNYMDEEDYDLIKNVYIVVAVFILITFIMTLLTYLRAQNPVKKPSYGRLIIGFILILLSAAVFMAVDVYLKGEVGSDLSKKFNVYTMTMIGTYISTIATFADIILVGKAKKIWKGCGRAY